MIVSGTITTVFEDYDGHVGVVCGGCRDRITDSGVCRCGTEWTVIRVGGGITINTRSAALPPKRRKPASPHRHHDHLIAHHIRSPRRRA